MAAPAAIDGVRPRVVKVEPALSRGSRCVLTLPQDGARRA